MNYLQVDTKHLLRYLECAHGFVVVNGSETNTRKYMETMRVSDPHSHPHPHPHPHAIPHSHPHARDPYCNPTQVLAEWR